MSDTDEMVRLMKHAASLLGKASPQLAASNLHGSDKEAQLIAIAGMAYAKATLELVAASVKPAPVVDLGDLMVEMLAEGYESWAEEQQRVQLSPGELGSVAEYLRWRTAAGAS